MVAEFENKVTEKTEDLGKKVPKSGVSPKKICPNQYYFRTLQPNNRH